MRTPRLGLAVLALALVAPPALAEPGAETAPGLLAPGALGELPESRPDPVLGAVPLPAEPEPAPTPAPVHEAIPTPAFDGGVEARAPAPGLGQRVGLFARRLKQVDPMEIVAIDLRGGAYLQLMRNLSLSGSYRVLDFDISVRNSELEAELHGPLFGFALSF